MTETNPPAVPLTLAERIAQQIDWTPTCLPGTERATIVRQILDLSGVRDREQSAEHPVTRMERGIRTALFGTDAEVAAARAEPSGDTVQAPDVAALRTALQRVADVLDFADDAIDPPITTEIDTNIVRMALLDTEDAPPAELRRQIRALLGTDPTPEAGQ